MADQRKDALNFIIDNMQITTVFQPIVSLVNGNILGHEALSRITCKNIIKNPDMLFIVAEKYNRLWDLELLCRTTALEAALKFMNPPYCKKLFLNVNPNTMHDENFKKGFTKNYLKQYEITPSDVVFEITERNAIKDMSGFRSTIDHYKNQGFKIAIDDVGAGFSGLNLISEINPNFIKLDMELTRNIDKDSLKYALVKGMVELSKISNILLIAEGIETYEELSVLIKLGVQFGQGYYFQKPHADIKVLPQKLLETIAEINSKNNQSIYNNVSNICIKNLCVYTDVIPPTAVASSVYDIIKRDPNCFGMCVIDKHKPVGIITRDKLALKLSGNYGFSLYQNKPISELMDKDFLSVDLMIPINAVSASAMSRSNDRLYDFIVVTKNEKYVGTVTIKVLLQKATEIEVSTAKHQNPLTGLPGNIIIEQKLNECVSSDMEYSVAYLDIHNFKAYNDLYGFENGDLVIIRLAEIIREFIAAENFIGHIGGDDFIVILNDHVNESFFSYIVERFQSDILLFYNKTDIINGYITTAGRYGAIMQFPLISLTCVVINNQTHKFNDVFELTEMLAELKKAARQ